MAIAPFQAGNGGGREPELHAGADFPPVSDEDASASRRRSMSAARSPAGERPIIERPYNQPPVAAEPPPAPPQAAAPAPAEPEPPRRRSTIREPAPIGTAGAPPPPRTDHAAADAGDFLDGERRQRPTQARLVGQAPVGRQELAHDPENSARVFGHIMGRNEIRLGRARRQGRGRSLRQGRHRAPIWRCAIYSTRLLGRDPKLVLHGGGNTSLKTSARDLAGDEVAVLLRQRLRLGHGRDRARRLSGGAARAVARLARARNRLSDDEMARVQRAYLIDPQAPSPSVEMLLHAFMPAKFVDHTHATAVLSLIDQPNAAELCAEVFGGRLGFVPYLMPGFGLAKKAAEVFDRNPKVEGLILDKHGIFTFGDDAREAYERMIEFVTLAEKRLKKDRKACSPARQLPQQIASADRGRADPARRLHAARRRRRRRAPAADPRIPHQRRDPQFRQRQGGRALRPRRRDHARPCDPHQALAADRARAASRQARRLHSAPRTRPRKNSSTTTRPISPATSARANGAAMHDPAPRVVLVPGLGLFGLGAKRQGRQHRRRHRGSRGRRHHRRRSDRTLHVDLAKPTCSTANIGRSNWPSSARARTCRSPARSRSITGAGGAIGAATAQRLRAGRRRGGAARSRCEGRAGKSQGDRRRGARARLRRDRRRLGAPTPSTRWSPPSAASISRSPTPAPPGRARSAKSTKRSCARASS